MNRKKEHSTVRFHDVSCKTSSVQKYSHAYLPRLNRQNTEISPVTSMDEQMHDLLDAMNDDKIEEDVAKLTAKQIINRLILYLRKISSIDFKSAFQIENIPQFSRDAGTLYYILPFKYEGVHMETLDPGYMTFKLPKQAPDKLDRFQKVRAYDGIHLSPLRLQWYISELVQKAVKRIDTEKRGRAKRNYEITTDKERLNTREEKGDIDEENMNTEVEKANIYEENLYEKTRYASEEKGDLDGERGKTEAEKGNMDEGNTDEGATDNTDDKICSDMMNEMLGVESCLHTSVVSDTEFQLPLTFKISGGWKVELLPAIFTSLKEPVYLMKPYEKDENNHSDIRWRICYAKRESTLLKSICNTDKDLRLEAMNVVLACLKCDSRLTLFSDYQIQTCLLHDMDFLMDNSPRWQRQTLQRCVQSLFKRVYDYVTSRNLPHFFIENFNLFEYWTENELKVAQSALGRLISNESAMMNLVQRTLRRTMDMTPVNLPENRSISTDWIPFDL
ncbi:hypothetical protein SNE40_014082 [Patella caerulea]